MFPRKIELILIVTIFVIIFTTLVYIFPRFAPLWLSLEVIIVPTLYLVGYELMMGAQKRKFREQIQEIRREARELEQENINLKRSLEKKLL